MTMIVKAPSITRAAGTVAETAAETYGIARSLNTRDCIMVAYFTLAYWPGELVLMAMHRYFSISDGCLI